MTTQIPTGAELRALLQILQRRDVIKLSAKTKVPFHTLIKIRNGTTPNPRIDTVAPIYPILLQYKLLAEAIAA